MDDRAGAQEAVANALQIHPTLTAPEFFKQETYRDRAQIANLHLGQQHILGLKHAGPLTVGGTPQGVSRCCLVAENREPRRDRTLEHKARTQDTTPKEDGVTA